MKKILKITGFTLLIITILTAIVGFIAWRHMQSNFFNFEGDYVERFDFKEMTADGYTFLDRNDNGKLDTYEDDRKPIAERVEDVLSQMTIEEKIHLLKGAGLASAVGATEEGEGIPGAVGTIVPTPRLGIPTVYLSDGPAGLRIAPTREGEDRTYYCTAFPIASMLSSTWNEALVEEVGAAMGKEALEYGLDVILGPGVNIHRHPLCGRNFEYYSEDPLVTGTIGAAMVNGIESNGVGATPKHFVANNQETGRDGNDARVSERAMREIYLKGFEIIVEKSQPWAMMTSYNKVNGTHASQNKYLLTDILRDEWGFEGMVMTDWFGGIHAPDQVSAGNDLLEPGNKKKWKALIKAYEDGELAEATIDISVRRILRLIMQSRKMQNYKFGNNPDLKKHAEITRRSAAEGVILLKNEDALPIQNNKNIALLGVTSYDFIAGGTGSGDVNEAYTISLEEGLKNAGFALNETAKNAFESHKAANQEAFEKPEGMNAIFTPYAPPEINLTAEKLTEIANEADIGILTIGRNSGEGGDRVEADDFLLSNQEQEMMERICKAFHEKEKKVVVVLNVGGVIETASWKARPDAILLAWQGGQEGGNSVADILSGKVNPSGKLPMTFPIHLKDHASDANFPVGGENELNPGAILGTMLFGKKEKSEANWVKNQDYTEYEEGIYVGYRHFDKANLAVSYPFGYGLSYTDFEYSDMKVVLENDQINVKLKVKNTGDTAGKEVVQLYVSKPDSGIDRPNQELRGFAKTKLLNPGASEDVQLQIPMSDLQYWDEEKADWVLENGNYIIGCGASSRDIRLVGEVGI